jgi:methionine-rich copper-binding protein CopC
MTRRLLSAAVMLGVALAVPPCAPAEAHALVLESHPAANETITGPDIDIVLRFNGRIDKDRSRLDLTLPDGSSKPLAIESNEEPEQVLAKATGLAAGDYALRWQVLALDGHITRGNIPFRVTAP